MQQNEIVLPFRIKGIEYTKPGDTFFVIKESENKENLDISIKIKCGVFKSTNTVCKFAFEIIFDDLDDQIMMDCIFVHDIKYPIRLIFDEDKFILAGVKFIKVEDRMNMILYKDDEEIVFYDKQFEGNINFQRTKEELQFRILDCIINDGIENPTKYLCFLKTLNFRELPDTGYDPIDDFDFNICPSTSNGCTF